MAERALSASMLAAIASGSLRPFLLYEGEYVAGGAPAFLRLFTGVGTLSWDGKSWTGGRDLLSISPIRESTSLEAIGFSVRLSGMPVDKLSLFLQSMRKNRAGKLWLGFSRPVAYLSLPGTASNYASTPDSAEVSITGDIDLRARLAADDWTPASVGLVVGRHAGAQRSFFLWIHFDGTLQLMWNPDGTAPSNHQVNSTVATGFVDGSVHWVRATLDVDDGAGNNVIKFYTSDDGVAWVQLGATITTAGVASIFDGTAPLSVGADGGGAFPLSGKVYYAELRNGIDGPVVAKFDPLRFSSGALTATAETGEVWTVNQSGSPAAVIVPQPDEIIPDPYPLRRGRFDVAPISRDPASGTITIEAKYEGPLARLLVPNVRHYTHEDQQLRLAGDKGFDQVEELQDTQDIWGPEVPVFPKTSRTPRPDPSTQTA